MRSLDAKRVTVADAAVLCDVNQSTIKRDLRSGRYPGASRGTNVNDPWLIPVSDLVAAGRYTAPPDEELQPGEIVRHRRAERDVTHLQGQLAAAQLRGDLLKDEVDYLRTLLDRRAV